MLFFTKDSRDGNTTGRLHGRQVFVCRRDFGIFVPVQAVIPEENFDTVICDPHSAGKCFNF